MTSAISSATCLSLACMDVTSYAPFPLELDTNPQISNQRKDDVNTGRHGRSHQRRVSIGADEEKLKIGQTPHPSVTAFQVGGHISRSCFT